MIDLILWDIDGTLMDFKASEKKAIKAAFADFGIDITDDEISLYSEINDKCWKMYERGEIERKDVFTRRFYELFKITNFSCDVEKLNEIYLTYLGEKYVLQDNSLQVVTSLKGKYRQYIVTNGHVKPQTMKIADSGLGDVVDGVFIYDAVGCPKPEKEYFDYCFLKIGNVDLKKTIIIGDSLSSDMRGGNNAGIICCWYNPAGIENKTDIKIDYEIKSLSEVYDVLEKIK